MKFLDAVAIRIWGISRGTGDKGRIVRWATARTARWAAAEAMADYRKKEGDHAHGG